MKKIIIAALTMLTLGATQAEYTLKIPLEQAQSGSLPNNSITIRKTSGGGEPSTLPENKKECEQYKSGYSFSESETNNQLIMFQWNGQYFGLGYNGISLEHYYFNVTTNEVIHYGLIYDGQIKFGEHKYTKGDYYMTSRGKILYGICREPI